MDSNANFGRRDEKGRTVTAHLQCAEPSRDLRLPIPSPPPPTLFCPLTSTHRPNLFLGQYIRCSEHYPHLFIFNSPCLRFRTPFDVRLCLNTPFASHTNRTREEAVVEEQSSASRGKDRVGRHGRAIFILIQGRSNDGRLATPISDMFSVNEHYHHHILELTPPLPTQPSVLLHP